MSLAQIHAALAYYYDHQAELDEYMKESERMVEALRQKSESDPEYIKRHEKFRQIRERARGSECRFVIHGSQLSGSVRKTIDDLQLLNDYMNSEEFANVVEHLPLR